MAAGSQALKGNCADLVKETNKRRKIVPAIEIELAPTSPKITRKATSPKRFLRPVKRPLDKAARERYQKIRKREVKPNRSHPTNNDIRLPEIMKIDMLTINEEIK